MIGRERALYAADPAWSNWREFVVTEKVTEAEGMVSVHLRPEDGRELPSYLPGQFVSVNVMVPASGYKQTRQYSLSDRPHPDHYRISVKKDDGATQSAGCVGLPSGVVSNIIHDDIKVGDVIQVSKPRGVFHLDEDDDPYKPIALLSAGSGVTPMMAILESLVAKQSRRRVRWVHVTRNSKTHAFRDRIRQLAQLLDEVKVLTVYSRPSPEDREGEDYDIAGRVSPQMLLGKDDLALYHYYICGPSSFMEDVGSELRSRGVPEEGIKQELFGTGGLPEPDG